MNALLEHYRKSIAPQLLANGHYRNPMEAPRMLKIVLNSCVGSSAEKQAVEEAVKELSIISGQKPVITRAKKSVSNFKLRKNQEIGCKVTLRGARMYEFMERFFNTTLPRVRDFRGASLRAFDGRGAYTFGVDDQTIFPEIELDKIKRRLGMDITFVTSARGAEQTKELLKLLGMPFAIAQAKAEKPEVDKQKPSPELPPPAFHLSPLTPHP